MNNLINLDVLQSDVEDLLINYNQSHIGCRIQQVFEATYLTFFIYWFDENNFAKHIGIAFPYAVLINCKGDLVKKNCYLLEKEIKNA